MKFMRWELEHGARRRCFAEFVRGLTDREFRELAVGVDVDDPSIGSRFLECLVNEPVYLTSLIREAVDCTRATAHDEVDEHEEVDA
jgi:hypothetical protein